MTQPPESYDIRVVPSPDETPTPDHLASADNGDETPTSEPPKGKTKRRLFGPPSPTVGTKDFQPPRDPRPVPPLPRNFAAGVEKMYGTVALAAMAVDMELATTIMNIAPQAAKAWEELARRNITVRRILLSLMETSAWGAVIAAHLPLFLLMIRKFAGDDPRFSALGQMLGDQAEDYINNPPEGQTE